MDRYSQAIHSFFFSILFFFFSLILVCIVSNIDERMSVVLKRITYKAIQASIRDWEVMMLVDPVSFIILGTFECNTDIVSVVLGPPLSTKDYLMGTSRSFWTFAVGFD